MAWQTIKHRGDIHVMPVNDGPFHTVPMCWCKPRPENAATKRGPAQAVIYSHNALDPRL